MNYFLVHTKRAKTDKLVVEMETNSFFEALNLAILRGYDETGFYIIEIYNNENLCNLYSYHKQFNGEPLELTRTPLPLDNLIYQICYLSKNYKNFEIYPNDFSKTFDTAWISRAMMFDKYFETFDKRYLLNLHEIIRLLPLEIIMTVIDLVVKSKIVNKRDYFNWICHGLYDKRFIISDLTPAVIKKLINHSKNPFNHITTYHDLDTLMNND